MVQVVQIDMQLADLVYFSRCIPKMDHHCPWTANCVSHTTFPYFIRFIFYAVLSMSILAYHLFRRIVPIWNDRNLPSYLGPPTWTLVHLLLLVVLNGFTLFALAILLVRSVYSLAIYTTMIESWEIERHEALVRRARKSGGYVYGSGGQKMRVERQEFPYDIGIWRNLCQGMGTSVFLLWFLPFAPGPEIETGASFEVNGFEDASKVWPPPDPDKMPRAAIRLDQDPEIRSYRSPAEEKIAFRQRQEEDFARRRRNATKEVQNGGDSDEWEPEDDESEFEEYEEGLDGEEGWTNSEGERLRDFGVDEDAEIVADDDIPLGELLRRRRANVAEDEKAL
jgi:palmitoyltransferase